MTEPKAFATFNRVIGVNYDSSRDSYYKEYSSENEVLPVQMMMVKRDPYHYLNVNTRCKELS